METKEISKDQVIDILKTVIDPEIGINIIDIGLVYDVSIKDKVIKITMTLTTPGCPMHGSITDWVQRVITKTIPGSTVYVNLVWEPKWSPEKMSDEAKQQLGM